MNKEKAYAYLKAVWPTVYRLINGAIYFLIHLIRSIVIMGFRQLTGKY